MEMRKKTLKYPVKSFTIERGGKVGLSIINGNTSMADEKLLSVVVHLLLLFQYIVAGKTYKRLFLFSLF